MKTWVRGGATAAFVLALAAAGVGIGDVEPPPGEIVRASAPAPSQPALVTASGRAPNVVMVMTDDMRADDLAAMPITRDLLADRGMAFSEAMSPHPLCCPARAELVTGQYAQNNGVRHNKGPYGGFQALDPAQQVSPWFERAGYRTGFVGKFLNGYGAAEPRPPGWERWDALTAGVYDYRTFTFDNDGAPQTYTDAYVTDVIAERTNETVRRFAQGDEPFLVYSWHLAPHYRINDRGLAVPPPAAEQDKGLFADAVPPSYDNPSFNERDVADQPRPFRHRVLADPDLVVAEHRARLRALQAVDRAVGTLVDTLRSVGELDDTVIVFTSDNGYSLGEHRLVGKNVLTQEALDVPLIMRGPGIAPGAVSTLPATLVDVPATLIDLGGVEPGWLLDGTSLVPSLLGRPHEFRDTTLVQTGDEEGDGWAYRGLKTDRYLYGVNGDDGFLYDNLVDPHQIQDRYDDPAYALVVETLERRRIALLDCRGWTCNTTFGQDPEPVPE